MTKLKKNKRGSLADVVVMAALLLFFGIILLFGSKLMDAFNTEIQGRSDIPARAKTASTDLNADYGGTLDYSFLLLTIGLGIVTLILAALVRIHPVFIPLFFIGLLFVIVLCGVFSNIYQEMAEDSELTALADELTFTSHILEYLPLIVAVFGILLMIVMYKIWSVNQ